jgi:large subunit ribosomal protein L25
LPEFIEVDLANLDVGHSIHLSELKLPANVQIVELTHGADHDVAVVSMQAAKVAAE